jgi:sortase A
VGEAQLEQGPGHYQGTSLPGEAGNVAIAGHRTTYAHPFYNLDALSPGDNIYILTAQGLFQYTVNGSQVVDPTDVAVLNTTPGKSTLTLTTCNPRYSAATRLVVTADLDAHPAPQLTTTPTTHPGVPQLAGESGASSLGGGSSPWAPVIIWGLVTVGLVVGAYAAWRWAGRRALRVAIVIVAVPLFLLSLLMCFEHVSLALPGSF